jgi:DNA-binding GntR family transcriptional regulator
VIPKPAAGNKESFGETGRATMARSRSNTSSAQASEVPLYRRLVDALRADIANGTHPIGTRLPTENELCRRFGVSRHTVREALRVLRDEGLVASRQGAGTTALRRVARSLYTYTVSSVEELLQYASEARYQVDKSSVIAADGALAEKLGCPVGQR